MSIKTRGYSLKMRVFFKTNLILCLEQNFEIVITLLGKKKRKKRHERLNYTALVCYVKFCQCCTIKQQPLFDFILFSVNTMKQIEWLI